VSQTVRVIIMNADESAAPELRAHLLSAPGVKIVAEIDEPAVLAQALDQFPAEVVLIHLDPNPAAMMDLVTPAIEARKDRFAAIAMTESRDAELVMRAMRAGMKEFLWKPFPPEQLTNILARVATQGPGAGRRLGRLIPIVGSSGGVGVTTLATNLAVELAQMPAGGRGLGSAGPSGGNGNGTGAAPAVPRAKVALVDLDLRFGQAAMLLDAQTTYSIANLCESPEQIEPAMIDRCVAKHPSGVHILAHPPDLAQAERITAGQCAGVLAALQEHYEFVVVDGPVRFDPTARAVFDMADLYLVVLQLLVPSVRNTDRLIQAMLHSGYATERLRLVCNRHGREAGYLEPADVETTLGRKLDWILPDDWKTASTAVNMGAPLADYAPKSKLRLGYRQIALALAQREEPGGEADADASADGAPRKGLFSFLAGQK
jgi:pilus assembly protein CpaE